MNNPFFLFCFRAFRLLQDQVIIFAMNFSQVNFSFLMLTAMMTTSLNLVAILLMKGESVNSGRKYGTSGSDMTLFNGKTIITVNNSKLGHTT
jgi:hypothetical protein